jgi:hypothetical protein
MACHSLDIRLTPPPPFAHNMHIQPSETTSTIAFKTTGARIIGLTGAKSSCTFAAVVDVETAAEMMQLLVFRFCSKFQVISSDSRVPGSGLQSG